MRRSIISCVLAGTFALGSGAAVGDDGSSEGLSKWLRNPFAKEAQPAPAGRRGGGTQRSVPSAAPSAGTAITLDPEGAADKPPGPARRLPGPRAARMTLADEGIESEPVAPTSAEMPRRRLIPQVRVDEPTRSSPSPTTPVTARTPESSPLRARKPLSQLNVETSSEPVGEGVAATPNEATDPPLTEPTASPSRAHLILRRSPAVARESVRSAPTTARRKVSAKSGEPVPALAVDTGELDEVQVIGDQPETQQLSEESPAATRMDEDRTREPLRERTMTASPERPSLTQRWKSWWGAAKK